MTHVMQGETTRGRNDSGRNDSGRTGKWAKRPVTIRHDPRILTILLERARFALFNALYLNKFR